MDIITPFTSVQTKSATAFSGMRNAHSERSSHFSSEKLMDFIDDKRIEAITPYFTYYGLQDLIPVVKEKLLEIRGEKIEKKGDSCIYVLDNYNVYFGNTFKSICVDNKMFLIEMIKSKYPDLDVMITRARAKLNLKWYDKRRMFTWNINNVGQRTIEYYGSDISLMLSRFRINYKKSKCVFTLTVHKDYQLDMRAGVLTISL